MSAPELVTKVKETCGNLLQACKKLVNGVEQRSAEEEFVVTARACAAGALDVHKLITEHISNIPDAKQEQTNLSQTFILEASSKLRESVVLLVKFARNLQNNPVDFLSKQHLALYEAEMGTENEDDASKASPSADGTPAPSAAEITKDLNIGQELADQSGIVLKALQTLADAIADQNADAFNAATKEAVAALQGLTTALQKAVKTENALKALLEANLQVITAAKVYFKKPSNEQFASKFQDARNDVVKAMRELLFEVSKSNARLSRTLSRGISQKQIGGVLRQGVKRESSTGLGSSSPKINVEKPAVKPEDSPKARSDSAVGSAGSSPSNPRRLGLPSDSSPPNSKKNGLADSGSIDKDPESPGREGDIHIRRRKASTNLSLAKPEEVEDSGKKANAESAATDAKSESHDSLSPLQVRANSDKPRMKRIESTELRTMIADREATKVKEGDDKDKKDKKDKKKDPKRLSRSSSSRPKDATSRTRKDSLSQSTEESMEDSTEDTSTDSSSSTPSKTPAPVAASSSAPSSPATGPILLNRSSPSTARLPARHSSGSLGALDKTAIAHRILDVIKQKFPNFASDWDGADAAVKLGVEAKIVAEIALYHIAVLQDSPAARTAPSSTPATSAVSKVMHPAAQAMVAANMAVSAGEEPKDKKKDRPTKSQTSGKERPEKSKTALPAFMRGLFAREKDEDGSKKKAAVEDLADEKEKAQMQELERIMEMKDPAELSGMTMRLKGAFRLKASSSKTPIKPEKDEPLTARGGDIDTKAKINALTPDKTPELAQQFAVAVQFLIIKIKDSLKQKQNWDSSQIYNTSKKAQSVLRSILGFVKDMAQDQVSSEVVMQVFSKTDDDIENERSGKIQEVDSSLATRGRYTRLVRKQLQQSLNRWCASLHFTTAQINTDLFDLTRLRNSHAEIDVSAESTMLHICALMSTFLTTLEQVLNDLETLHYFVEDELAAEESSSSESEEASNILSPRPSDAPTVTPSGFWDTFSDVSLDIKELFKPATLNIIVARCLNAPVESQYQSTVLETYNSFASPDELLSKLIEAFFVPKGKMDDARTGRHQKRVMDFLSSWVRYCHRYDFDARFAKRLRRFLDDALKAAPDEADAIKAVIEDLKMQDSDVEETDAVDEIPKEITAFEADVNPFSFILCFDSMLIAKQLTRIEYEIYRRIDPIELKGQAWNKPKRQCVSRNILSLIQRANRLSFWIATCILLQPKLKDRGRVVVKIINIAQQLKEMNNFNTLMGFVAGLNMSCVSRLKNTFNQVSKRSMEQYRALQELLDPKSSFKSLRDAIKNGGTTILPYIGTTLSDLTFMEDGNPDFGDEAETLINMEKRRLVANSIGQIKQYQVSGFNKLTVRDPPFSFLVELPSLGEQMLYALSLEREPRESTATRGK